MTPDLRADPNQVDAERHVLAHLIDVVRAEHIVGIPPLQA